MNVFEDIYKEYYDDIFRFLMKLTSYNIDYAEELTQETFYRAYIAIDNFRGQCHIKSWLCQIGKNVYYLVLKRKNTIYFKLHNSCTEY